MGLSERAVSGSFDQIIGQELERRLHTTYFWLWNRHGIGHLSALLVESESQRYLW